MADHSHIEWTDATWNPVTGCSVVSPGCTNCYAMKLAGTRLKHHPSRAGLTTDTKAGPVWNGTVRFNENWLDQPLRWKKPRMIFVCAHGDLFHPDVPDSWIDQVFAVMALCPHHTFQLLTKRPERMRAYLAPTIRAPLSSFDRIAEQMFALVGDDWPTVKERCEANGLPWTQPSSRDDWWPLPNVWLGTSVEDQRRADERIPHLLATPAAVRFLSAEPLLGPVDLRQLRLFNPEGKPWIDALTGSVTSGGLPRGPDEAGINVTTRIRVQPALDWVIVGGESGDGARPMHPDWARTLRDQCAAAGVPFFFKQWGEWTPGENVERHRGRVRTATWWNDAWIYGTENLARDDGHIDDEPDLYALGKKAAGRRLDGIEHNGMPEARP